MIGKRFRRPIYFEWVQEARIMARQRAEEPPIEIEINPERVCFIIVKAREFDAKVAPVVEDEPGSNPTDDQDREVLEDRSGDPTLAELTAAIEELNIDEIIDLIALTWVGRGDFGRGEWEEAR